MHIAIDTLYEHPERPTGSLDYLRLMVGELPRVGPQHEFCVLASDRNLRHFRDAQVPNLRVRRCFCSNENMPLRILQQQTLVPWLLRKWGVDVLYAPGNVSPLWGDVCCVLKINTLHHYHTPQLLGRLRAEYRKRSFAASARRAAHIIANTELTKQEIRQFMRLPEEKITVVPEPVYGVYRPVPGQEAAPILQRYGLTPGYILFVSTLFPYKNVQTLLRAFATLNRENEAAADLIVVGRDCDGQLAKLRSLTDELGLGERVRFLGFLPADEMPAIYSQARAFVFPSLVETFGKPLLEAMQCGVPIVASNTSCMPEVLGGAGLLVDPLDPAEMAAAIRVAAEPGAIRASLIECGLQRGRQFSAHEVAKQTLAILESAFAQTRGRREKEAA